MIINEKAEAYFQDSLAKFCTGRKSVDGFVSSGFEREMFKGGYQLALDEVLTLLRSRDSEEADGDSWASEIESKLRGGG